MMPDNNNMHQTAGESGSGEGMPPRPAPADMSPEEAKASVLDFINQMANLKASAGSHKPVLKTLEELGVPVINKTIEINGVERNCLVIPVSDLLLREYEAITGYNASSFMLPHETTPIRPPAQYNFNQIEK